MNFIELTNTTFKEPRENHQLEYKASTSELSKDIWTTYSAFANTSGGLIILGVSESKSGYEIVGVTNPDQRIKELWNLLHSTQKVNCNLLRNDDVIKMKVEGKYIIQIKVPKADLGRRPIYINDNKSQTYIRTDDGDRKANDDQFKYLVTDSKTDIDSELLDNYDMDDLNLEDVESYKKMMIEATKKEELFTKDSYDFLCEIGVFKRDRRSINKEYKLTAGGLLFFGKTNSITDRFSKFQLDYFKKETSLTVGWDDRVSSGDMNYPELNIFSFYKIILKKLSFSIPDKYMQSENMTRGSYKSDLLLALKEALVNSLMHAYYDSDKVIKIVDYDRYVEFENPGEMKVSKEEFIHGSVSTARNSIIPTLFRRVGIAEKAGSGGPRIYEAAANNHLRSPEIILDWKSTTIRIWKIDMLESMDKFDEIEREIIEYAIEKNTFKIKEIIDKTGFTDYKIRQAIDRLVEKKYLLIRGKGRATVYNLSHTEEMGIHSIKKMLMRMEDVFLK